MKKMRLSWVATWRVKREEDIHLEPCDSGCKDFFHITATNTMSTEHQHTGNGLLATWQGTSDAPCGMQFVSSSLWRDNNGFPCLQAVHNSFPPRKSLFHNLKFQKPEQTACLSRTRRLLLVLLQAVHANLESPKEVLLFLHMILTLYSHPGMCRLTPARRE